MLRERSPGVWEVRVVVGFDARLRRSVQRSFTVHGDREVADRRRSELVGQVGVARALLGGEGARLNVGDLLARWMAAPQAWKQATTVSHASVVRALPATSAAGAGPPPGPSRGSRKALLHPIT